MARRQVTIQTADGPMGTYLCYPEGGGPYPPILFLMDGPGIRDELRSMACRLAGEGYYVVLPNLYYRNEAEELGDWSSGPDVRKRIEELMTKVDAVEVQEDIGAILQFIDQDPLASNGPAGAVGYCMSGRHAIGATLSYPGRVVAAASIYGTKLVDASDESFHYRVAGSRAELSFAWAERDSYAPIQDVPVLSAVLIEAGVDARIEVYPNVDHGFAFKSFSTFNRNASERHWNRLFDLFDRNLKTRASA